MAAERLVTGAHTGTDVVGGFLLGAGLAAAYATLLPMVDARRTSVHARTTDGQRRGAFCDGEFGSEHENEADEE
jgi:hypothetical protein